MTKPICYTLQLYWLAAADHDEDGFVIARDVAGAPEER